MTLLRTEIARGHRYELDGEPVTGVTTLIGGGLPKPALVPWAAKSAARYAVDHWRALAPLVASGQAETAYDEIRRAPFRERNAAAVRGTEVHRYAEALSRGEDVNVPDELYGYVSACADFLDDWAVRPLLTEAVIGSRAHFYAGTLDIVAALPFGEVALFDYKTSASGIWPETALQAAAYRYADFYLTADGTEADMADLAITAAILTGTEMGLSPMAALRSFDLIKGTPAMRANAMRALVQSHGHAIWEEETTATHAVVCGRRAGETEVHSSEWTIERARDAQLTGKDNWKRQPTAMLLARATAEACRLIASDVLHGVPYAAEELTDGATGETRTVRRRKATTGEPAAAEPTPEHEQTPAADEEAAEHPADAPLWTTETDDEGDAQ
ncbi:hypothetical protein ACFY12_35090 [Streptomyces sp. NPDC001339]|uniref:hypothetical protein n=1 Tax=Streptomyces sp. NPDC001339 TaxID=3364563 RepID=UPI003678B81C